MRDYFEQRIRDELDAEGEFYVAGRTWPSSQVFENMDKPDFDAHVDETVQEKIAEAKQRARNFLDQTACLNRFRQLCEKKDQRRVLPFVGAGMSVASGFPAWSDLLERMCADSALVEAEVGDHTHNGRFEEAAQAVADFLGPNQFHADLEAEIGLNGYQLQGAVKLLPYSFSSGCITTNLDNVLERVYRESANRFDQEVWGENLREQQGFLNPDENKLFKLHGTASARAGRVITRDEYQNTYDNNVSLSQVLEAVVANRSLLFIGCSLSVDRTVRALSDICANARLAPPSHFAFLPLTPNTDRENRRTELSSANIAPIWYPCNTRDDHEAHLEDLLICLAEGGVDD